MNRKEVIIWIIQKYTWWYTRSSMSSLNGYSVWASREEATRHVEEDGFGHRVKEVEFGQILPLINDESWVEG